MRISLIQAFNWKWLTSTSGWKHDGYKNISYAVRSVKYFKYSEWPVPYNFFLHVEIDREVYFIIIADCNITILNYQNMKFRHHLINRAVVAASRSCAWARRRRWRGSCRCWPTSCCACWPPRRTSAASSSTLRRTSSPASRNSSPPLRSHLHSLHTKCFTTFIPVEYYYVYVLFNPIICYRLVVDGSGAVEVLGLLIRYFWHSSLDV